MVRRRLPRHAQQGATLVEFSLAVTLIVLPLVLLTLQLSLLAISRRVLDVAVVMSARAGAADRGRVASMRVALAQALLPLHATAANFRSDDYRSAGLAAASEVQRADFVQLTVRLPQLAAPGANANEGFDRRAAASAAQNQRLLDRNLLTIDLRYCAAMIVPIAGPLIAAVLRGQNDDAFDARCYRQGRLPMVVRNTQVMQSTYQGNL